MNSRNTTYRELCGQILDIYKVLLDDPALNLSHPEFETLSHNKIILERVKKNNKLSTGLFSSDEIFTFLQTLLDSYGIASASGSADLTILDTTLIGGKRYRVGNLKENHVRDFQFSKLFQGWWNSRHREHRIRDLALDSKLKRQQGRLCDYAIPLEDNNIELVECKRIHPHPLKTNSFEDLADKIIDKTNEAGVQLLQTEKKFSQTGKRILCKSFLLDISYYSNPEQKKIERGFEVGGFDKEEIEEIKDLVLSGDINKRCVDRITLCWSQVVFKGDLPIAIQQCVAPIAINGQAKDIVDYLGWTVEAYPRKVDLRRIVDLRISICARGLPWIKAGYLSGTDSLLRWGHEERRENLDKRI